MNKDLSAKILTDAEARGFKPISGTTVIECPGCKGEGMFSGNYHCSHCGKAFRIVELAGFIAHQSDCDYVCPKCDNGVIKHKWKIAAVLENGELPEVTEDYPFERLETQADMLNEDWAKEVRQVVE